MNSAAATARRGRPVRIAGIVRAVAIVLAAAAAIWFALAVTVSLVLGARLPAAAQKWGLYSADVTATLAAQIVGAGGRGADVGRARRLAEASLAAEAVNVPAARTLGLVASLEGNQRQAERLFRYSESLSRRDSATQLWLIESEVTRGNIDGALLHYDRALRTSTSARTLLLPILVQASGDPAIAEPLAAMVERRPPWWEDFAHHLVNATPMPRSLAMIMSRLRLDAGKERERAMLLAALARLAAGEAHADAYRLYRAAGGDAGRGPHLVRNGGFEAETGLIPFDWELRDETGLAAIREPRDGGAGAVALSLLAENGRGGDVAKQLLVLRPGTYALAMRIGDVRGDPVARPAIGLRCAAAAGQVLFQIRFPDAPAAGAAFGQRFTVPAGGCGAQWLTLSARSGLSGEADRPWIDAIAIRPI